MRRLHGGELAAKLAAKTVFFNLAERKSTPLTEPMLERLKSWMAAAPSHGSEA
jgi:acyl-CoA thioester hydrolase